MKISLVVAAILLIGGSLVLLRRNKPAEAPDPAPPSVKEMFFVFAKIIDPVMPVERGEKYEDPLDAMLHEKHLGEVTGGGTLQRKDKSIEFVGVDIELIDLGPALEATRIKLRQLGAPKGSVLEFKRDGKDIVLPIHEN